MHNVHHSRRLSHFQRCYFLTLFFFYKKCGKTALRNFGFFWEGKEILSTFSTKKDSFPMSS
uniref:Uncharacterized protein n=1 Tax=Arundo donax TaxID=35708 RepID=A0A0A8YMZ8_ARUDO